MLTREACNLQIDSGQSYSVVIFGCWRREDGMTSSSTLRRRTLATGSYILGWLRPIEPVYSSSWPSLYLNIPWHFRFGRASACPRLGGAADAGSCHTGSLSRGGDTLGARSGPRRNRSGVLKARVIVLTPWDSPAGLGVLQAS